jgi:hypothetical protein
MSLRKYFKAKDTDPHGSLSDTMTSKAIALANMEVNKNTNTKKRGSYKN